MMRKILGAAALLAATAMNAHAQEMTMKPYVGVDVQRTKISYKNGGNDYLEDNLNGIGVHVGNRFHRNFGAEVGGFYNFKQDEDIAGLGTTEIRSFGFAADGMGYFPLNSTVELIGTAGVTWTKARFKYNIPGLGLSGSESEDEFGLRGGGGAQINVDEAVSLRVLARYQTADFDDTAGHAWIYSIGANYSF